MTETQIRRRICVFSVYIHHFEQATDTGLKINLLQEYNFIALDIFRKNIYNKGIQNELEAWLTFLSVDDPEMIVELLKRYPRFQPMYEEIYEMCRSTERVMGMFSKELKELDDNTVEFMIDELQEMVDKERARAEEEKGRADRAEARTNEAEQEKRQALEKVKEIQQKYEELLQQQSFVYTFPKYRGHRYVGGLIEYAETLAKADGKDSVYISTNHNGLYEKYGYEFYQMMKDIGGEDSRVYIKRL
mgnify:FL=1